MKITFNTSVNRVFNFRKEKQASQPILKDMPFDSVSFMGKRIQKTSEIDFNEFQTKDKTLYIFNPDGTYEKFLSPKHASQITGISQSEIHKGLKPESGIIHGKVIAKASDVEVFNKEENLEFSTEKANKVREKFLTAKSGFMVAAINDKSEIFIFNNAKEASFETGISNNSLRASLSNQRRAGDFVFTRLDDIVKRDNEGNVCYKQDGGYLFDYDKLEELYCNTFGELD